VNLAWSLSSLSIGYEEGVQKEKKKDQKNRCVAQGDLRWRKGKTGINVSLRRKRVGKRRKTPVHQFQSPGSQSARGNKYRKVHLREEAS